MTSDRKNLRVVHLDTALELRGGQQQLLTLARGLAQRGHRQLIVCPESSALEARAHRAGFRVLSLPAHDPARAHGIFQLRRDLQTEPPEILHAHDGRGYTLGYLASLGISVRRLAHRRVTFLPRGPTGALFHYGKTADRVIAISEFVGHRLVESGVPKVKMELIHDGVEIPDELPDSEACRRARAELGFTESEFVVGHVGAFTKEKGQDIAIEAALLLAERLPEARLVLAGEGRALTPAMERRVGAAGGRIRLVGYVEDITGFFAGLDLFVMPSRSEGLGSAALLAMAHGLPVVASRAGGLPEAVEEGETGWLVPPESPAALAEAMLDAASDPSRLGKMGERARERARQFSSEKMVERTQSLYYRLLAPTAGPQA